jgi:hypothetical protein
MNAREYYQSIRADREAWRNETKAICFNCRRTEWQCGQLHIHECEKRSQAPRSWGHRANYVKYCPTCHGRAHDENWPHGSVLAMKQIHDRLHYNLHIWLSLKPRPSTYLTELEIEAFVAAMTSGTA